MHRRQYFPPTVAAGIGPLCLISGLGEHIDLRFVLPIRLTWFNLILGHLWELRVFVDDDGA